MESLLLSNWRHLSKILIICGVVIMTILLVSCAQNDYSLDDKELSVFSMDVVSWDDNLDGNIRFVF